MLSSGGGLCATETAWPAESVQPDPAGVHISKMNVMVRLQVVGLVSTHPTLEWLGKPKNCMCLWTRTLQVITKLGVGATGDSNPGLHPFEKCQPSLVFEIIVSE